MKFQARKAFINSVYPDNLGDLLPAILVKNLPENLLKELKRLKVELGCKTWADLLAELVASSEEIPQRAENKDPIEAAVKDFLNLRCEVSTKWTGHPTALEETRRARHHETS
jgi:hypothetical protein